MPSFHIDLHSGRGKSEVEWLNGAIVRHGRITHQATPVNLILTETLSSLVSGKLPVESFSANQKKLLKLLQAG